MLMILGTFGGAKSLAQARDAILNGESAFETIGKHFETLLAFRKWESEKYAEWVGSLTSDFMIVVDPDLRPYRYARG